jgi:hypothetical protein
MARHNTLCYVNCDIVLTTDFVESVRRVRAWRENFLMVGCRWDTEVTSRLISRGPDWGTELVRVARAEGYRRFYYNIDYFVFRRGMYAEIPPLWIGRVGWDHWLVGERMRRGIPIVDATGTVCAVHQNHDYGYHPDGMTGVWYDAEAKRNMELTRAVGAAENDRGCGVPTHGEWNRKKSNASTGSNEASIEGRDTVEPSMGCRPCVHPLLSATRPVRHVLGLRKGAKPEGLQRSKRRRHWLDAR